MLEYATIDPLGLCPPLLGKPPKCGAQLVYIPGLSGIPVPNGTQTAPVEFRWPQTWVLREFILVPQTATAADAACLQLYMQDVEGAVIFDGIGVADDAQFVDQFGFQGLPPRLALTGESYAPRWTSFGRLVEKGDRWTFAIGNTKGGMGSITPRLAFRIEEPIVPGSPAGIV